MKEAPMKAMLLSVLALVVLTAAVARLNSQMQAGHSAVEMTGVKAAMKFQAPVEGYMTALNGKVDMRASEIEIDPGGGLKEHYHYGPGIRHVLAGQLTLVDSETGKEQTVRAGEYFYESGARRHIAVNRGKEPVKEVVVELVPAGLKGPAMVPIDRRPELEANGTQLKDVICSEK
jgi:quercetin dioxygenase-like cupin family protein